MPALGTNPFEHAYVAVAALAVPFGVVTVPFVGLASEPQSTGAQVGALPLHAPDAPQVRVALPVSVKPFAQPYAAAFPTVVAPEVVTDPFAGAPSAPQSTSASQFAPV